MTLFLFSVALAWETHVDGAAPWSSLQAAPSAELNEHGRLLDAAMQQIDLNLALRLGDASKDEDRPLLTDYNATWYRRDDVPVLDADGETVVQERRIPRISTVAGLPDISFSVTDWINHNAFCPVLPEGAVRPELCHDYGGYLGAGLNATHFGALATKMYGRHHAIARHEAINARSVRDQLVRGGVIPGDLPDGSIWHADAVHEAELLALTFEAAGQHYLQDRLAVGHMFGRWGSGSYPDLLALTDSDPLVHAQAMGLLSGVQHGSFAVTGFPDGMNFPEDGAPALFSWEADGTFGVSGTVPAIGDDLRGALVDGVTPQGVFDFTTQRRVLMTCSAGGLRDIISEFSANADGTYGVDRIRLNALGSDERGPATPLGFDPSTEPTCTELWATNESYYRGSKLPNTEQIASKLVAKIVGRPELGELPQAGAFVRIGPAMLINRGYAFVNRITDGSGTSSAREGVAFDLDGFWIPNHRYEVPGWMEPEQLRDLPLDSSDGRDRRALDGLFHRAHPERTCDLLGTNLQTLRDAAVDPSLHEEDRRRAAATCASLARVAYKGTDPAYDGGPREERAGRVLPLDREPDTEPWGDAYEPLCAYYDGPSSLTVIRTSDASDDTRPYWLHPGYVDQAGALAEHSDSFASLDAWCRKMPVLDIDDQDVAGRLGHLDADRFVSLTGRNLGFRTTSGEIGSVRMQRADGQWQGVQIWDSATGALGGWGDTNGLDIVVPLASQGFPTLAEVGDDPALIKDAGSRVQYALTLTRAVDAGADAIFLADGAELVAPVAIEVAPSWVELAVQPVSSEATSARFWVVRPDAHQSALTRLVLGFYRAGHDGTYTPLEIPFTERDDQVPDPLSDGWTSEQDRLGIEVPLGGDVTAATFAGGDVVLFYAYH